MVIQNGCPTAYSERIGLKILNEEGSVGFQFDAFNWKNGGQGSDIYRVPCTSGTLYIGYFVDI